MLALRHAGASLAVGAHSSVVAAAAARRLAPCMVRGMHAARVARQEQNGDKKAAETAGNGDDSANKAALKSAEELHADLAEASDALKKCQELIEKEKAKADEFKDKYVRALAENENVRKRAKQEIENAKLFAVQKFAQSLLQVSDVFALAIDSVPKPELENEQNTALKQLHEGVIMTRDELHKVFRQFGIEKMEPLGAKFDPNAHEALFEMPDPSKEPGTVAVVQKTGYTLHGRTLRAAVVGVVRDPNA